MTKRSYLFLDSWNQRRREEGLCTAHPARWVATLLFVAPLFTQLGCQQPHEAPEEGVVATINGEHVTADHLRETFWFGPEDIRRRAMQPGGRRFLLDFVIGEHLLLQEVRERRMGPSFTDLYQNHQDLLQRFIEAEFDPTVSPADIPAAQVQMEYERVSPSLATPESVRIEMAFFEDEERARAMAARAVKAQNTRNDRELDRIMRDESDDWTAPPYIPQRGIYDHEQALRLYGAEIAEAAFSHTPPDIVHSEALAFREGWVVLVVPIHRESEPPPPLEEVEEDMRDRVFSRYRERRLDQFVDSFRENHTVVVNADRFELVQWSEHLPAPPVDWVGPSSSIAPPPPPPPYEDESFENQGEEIPPGARGEPEPNIAIPNIVDGGGAIEPNVNEAVPNVENVPTTR